ncbi:MAG TPA: peptidoglycan DD-metalloendopeptidase family protein [Actinomycetota bacterium]|nr:peptidoglycan DD-metalloendopeptidase family protein [Actinomycetota bacterium]
MLAQVTAAPVVAGPQQTKDRIEEARRRVKKLENEVREARSVLDGIRADIASITAQLSQTLRQIEALGYRIDDTKNGIRRRGNRVDRLQSQIDARAMNAYMAGPGGALELILNAHSLTDLSDRLTYLEVLNQRDADIATGLEVEREQLRRQKADLERYLADLEVLEEQQRDQAAGLHAKFEEQKELKESIERKLEATRNQIERLEKRYERERRALLARLRAQRAAAAPIVGNAGPLPTADGPFYACPVDTPRSYIDDFGYPRSGGRSHQGNDIFAATGTPIRAPFAGRADESYNSLGGTSVHVYASDGSGDYVYNAHLSQHAGVDGQQVRPGDLIGYVGNTGNAIYTAPHDHFEYHPGGGSAVSPYVYLNEVCGVGGG